MLETKVLVFRYLENKKIILVLVLRNSSQLPCIIWKATI